MTYKVWEKNLRDELASLAKAEQDRTIEYYREMYDEMILNGRTEESILDEFGTPEQCARKVLNSGIAKQVETNEAPQNNPKGKVSAAEVFGMILFTVFILSPLAAVAVSIVGTFAALCVSGFAVGVAGIGFAIGCPILGYLGNSAIVGIGAGLAVSGAGWLLFTAFFEATKGTAIAFWRMLKAVYTRR